MKIEVKAHTGSKVEKIEMKDGIWHIYTHKPPADNEANQQITKMLSDYFDKPITDIRIVRGISNSNKIIEIDD